MAYIRSEKLHIWSDGTSLGIKKYLKNGEEEWFSIPESVINEFVVMRHAELSKVKRNLIRTEKRALKNNYGNFGCDALAKKYGKPSVVEKLLKNK